jgi:hypothetical protein
MDLRAAMDAFQRPFSETDCLRRVWERAAENQPDFDQARGRFYDLVSNGQDADARDVRELLTQAGFELNGRNAPTLKTVDVDDPDTRLRSDLTLSIDHIQARADGGAVLDAENLRFITMRDNSFRGNRFDADDQKKGR